MSAKLSSLNHCTVLLLRSSAPFYLFISNFINKHKHNLQSKNIPIKCAAEFLAVKLIFPDSTKIILTTCYRVGTLETFNCNEILQTLNESSRKTMLRKYLCIGVFNVKGINWDTGNSSNSRK